MSYYDGFTPRYSFRLVIAREDATLLDTAVTAAGTAGDITRAKKTVRRLLDEYAPKIEPGPAPAPELPEEEAELPEEEAELPEEEAEPEPEVEPEPEPEPALEARLVSRQSGRKGALHLVCPDCGHEFGTFLQDYQETVSCRCGHEFDLTDPTLAHYEYDCVGCGAHRYGTTNFEGDPFSTACKCGRKNKLHWDRQTKQYTNQ